MQLDRVPAKLILEHFPVGPLACICTIFGDSQTGEVVVVDAGAEADRIVARLKTLGVRVVQLLHTHAHIDHIGAVSEMRSCTQAAAALHPADRPLARALQQQAAWLGLQRVPEAIFDNDILDQDCIKVGDFSVTVLHTPGHTPGSVSFALNTNASPRILSGDTLFSGGVGRWDLGGTSLSDIVDSIRRQFYPFPDETVVIPGHGPATTIGVERNTNPYLVHSD